MSPAARQQRTHRLERAGFAVYRAAVDLREVRERYPGADELARRLQAIEEEARTVAAQIARELRTLADH